MPDIVQYLKGQYVGLIMYFSLVYEHFVFSLLQSPTSPLGAATSHILDL